MRGDDIKTVADLLPYEQISNNLIFLKNGSIAFGFELAGFCAETKTPEELNGLHHSLHLLLNSLPGDAVAYQVCYVRSNRPFGNSGFSGGQFSGEDAVQDYGTNVIGVLTAARQSMWANAFAERKVFETRVYLFAICAIPNEHSAKARAGNLLKRSLQGVFNPEAITEHYARKHEEGCALAAGIEDIVRAALEKTGLNPRRLDDGQIIDLLRYYLNPDDLPLPPALASGSAVPQNAYATTASVSAGVTDCAAAHAAANATAHATARATAGVTTRVTARATNHTTTCAVEDLPSLDISKEWRYLKIGGTYVRAVTMRRIPDETLPAMIQSLTALRYPFWMSVRFSKVPKGKEISRIKLKRNMAEALNLEKNHNLKADVAVQEALELERELIIGDEQIFLGEWVVILSEPSVAQLELTTRELLMAFSALNGAEGLSETAANLQLWLSALPGGGTGEGDYRFHRMLTRNMADLLPVFLPYRGRGKPIILFETTEQTLCRYDPFRADLPNYNALVFGASGSGKSFLVQNLCMQLLSAYPDANLIFIDKGGSYSKFAQVFGGNAIQVSGEGDCAINPLDVEPYEEKKAYLQAVIGEMVREEGRAPQNDEKIVISLALDKARAGQRQKRLTIGSVAAALREAQYDNAAYREIGLRMSRHLERWTTGLHGRLLNNSQTRLRFNTSIAAIDLKDLENYPEIMRIFLFYITEMIWSACQANPGRKKLIIFDEVWALLGDEAGGRLISELYRTLRKYGAGIMSVSQDISDFRLTRHHAGILANTGTLFILKLSSAINDNEIISALNLNDREMELIRRLGQVKGEYAEVLVKGAETFVARVRPTPLEYWIASSDWADKEKLAQLSSGNEAAEAADTLWELIQKVAYQSKAKQVNSWL
ncbi:MAG: ATP-binding protein [Bacillota bacterium]